jgi:hypothetical protein
LITSFRIFALALLTLVVVARPAVAQKRPNFSGTWVEDESQRKSPYDKPAANSGVMAIAGPPPPLTITQTPERLTIERTRFEQTTKFVHDFDGRENKNHTGAQIHTTRTRWEGAKLVTEGSIYQVTSQGEESWKLKEVRWLTAKGELATEVTQVDEDGKAGTVLRVFKKQ